ncbi:hypothetical protein ES288_D12G111700v1 [Gossypium darwinii]|uniref:FAS1 domain-containing protein n=1 Tax=Gossypium darwinii TaxID=34276 RepID=A0A5D2A744_GOSDA|nr:hypothetical protein ES288_D12G111700v1 [Gossypium darwinii]
MAVISLNLIISLTLSFLSLSHSTYLPTLTSTITGNGTLPPPPPPPSPPLPPLFPVSPSPQPPHEDFPRQGIFSHTSVLPPILSHLGFNELATAALSLFSDSATSTATAWSGSYTIFAPFDFSVLTCISCSIPSLLREHMVPGLFPSDYLRKHPFGTKIETLSPGRCITVTSTSTVQNDPTMYKIFIVGVEITHPDLFNNGLIIIHGLQGYISQLSPFSCDVERMTSLSFPSNYDRSRNNQLSPQQHAALMRFMLSDVILRLRNSGFSVLSLALKLKYAELVSLRNVTIFALDDVSIFSGSYSYINSVRLHIVPNQFLTIADLERLPVGAPLTTLDREQSLVVTTAGGVLNKQMMRINYMSIKVADMMKNLNVIVHSLYLPFPHVTPMTATTDSMLGGEDPMSTVPVPVPPGTDDACDALDEQGKCEMRQVNHVTTHVNPHYIPEIEDHHGL